MPTMTDSAPLAFHRLLVRTSHACSMIPCSRTLAALTLSAWEMDGVDRDDRATFETALRYWMLSCAFSTVADVTRAIIGSAPLYERGDATTKREES